MSRKPRAITPEPAPPSYAACNSEVSDWKNFFQEKPIPGNQTLLIKVKAE